MPDAAPRNQDSALPEAPPELQDSPRSPPGPPHLSSRLVTAGRTPPSHALSACSAVEVMMGSWPRSPSACAAPCWGPQPAEPSPAKRRRTEEPEGPASTTAPSLQVPAGPPFAGALISVLVLAPGSALKVRLDDVDLVLEPAPAAVLQVSLEGYTLVLVPEALLEGGQGPSPVGLEPGALLSTPEKDVAVEQGLLSGSVPEIAAQEEAYEEDADPEFSPPWVDLAAGSVAGLCPFVATPPRPDLQGYMPEPSPWTPVPSAERRSPGPYFNLDLHLLEPFPSSPLQPLPPSPSPGPQVRPQRPPGPPPKARRRLFQD
ncbi:proline-rich protein 23C-like [Manis pentadactyla]|uniref:proline-rich protein 23C-like n=1 Tax=Manis pentadactyla TaxID=143292 RepID=UPI00255C386B|nr:proline-rich protein 23C-like [Manis pentadactyla]